MAGYSQEANLLLNQLDALRAARGDRIKRCYGSSSYYLSEDCTSPSPPPGQEFELSSSGLDIEFVSDARLTFSSDESMQALVVYKCDPSRLEEQLLHEADAREKKRLGVQTLPNPREYVSCDDPKKSTRYWASFIGRRIAEIFVATATPDQCNRFHGRPGQAGLWIVADNGNSMVISFALRGAGYMGEDFGIIRPEQIDKSVLSLLTWHPVL